MGVGRGDERWSIWEPTNPSSVLLLVHLLPLPKPTNCLRQPSQPKKDRKQRKRKKTYEVPLPDRNLLLNLLHVALQVALLDLELVPQLAQLLELDVVRVFALSCAFSVAFRHPHSKERQSSEMWRKRRAGRGKGEGGGDVRPSLVGGYTALAEAARPPRAQSSKKLENIHQEMRGGEGGAKGRVKSWGVSWAGSHPTRSRREKEKTDRKGRSASSEGEAGCEEGHGLYVNC